MANPDDENLSWMYRYRRSDGISVQDIDDLYIRIEGELDRFFPDRDLFFKGGLGHAHTTLYTGRYSPQDFLALNRGSIRQPRELGEDSLVVTSGNLSMLRLDEDTGGSWSTIIVSAADTPEFTMRLNGSLLLMMMGAITPVSAGRLAGSAITLAGGKLDRAEAFSLVRSLYEGGVLLAVSGDRRATTVQARAVGVV
jgi:hypothetical protein